MRSGGGGGGGGEAESWAISGRPLVYLCAACSSLCSILLGYDVGVMSGAKEYIEPDLGLTTVQNVSWDQGCDQGVLVVVPLLCRYAPTEHAGPIAAAGTTPHTATTFTGCSHLCQTIS